VTSMTRPRESRSEVGNKVLTEEQLLRIRCNEAMQRFGHHQRREWVIYGARHQVCPNCHQPPRQPCLNKVDINKGLPVEECRENRMPHDERIDWQRILDGLNKRGHIKGEWKGTRN
jgi:hypothetical protein